LILIVFFSFLSLFFCFSFLIEVKKATKILPPPAPAVNKDTPVKNETVKATGKKGGKGSGDPVAAARRAALEAQAQREKEIIEKATNAIKKRGKK
jgi:hypothetical protein